MVEDPRARRERWNTSWHVLHEPYLDDFAQVVARLAGKQVLAPAEVAPSTRLRCGG
jgi:hypothetical protein